MWLSEAKSITDTVLQKCTFVAHARSKVHQNAVMRWADDLPGAPPAEHFLTVLQQTVAGSCKGALPDMCHACSLHCRLAPWLARANSAAY